VNDFTTLKSSFVYWFAVVGPGNVTWTILLGP
jgi:hypothetical protein